MGTHPWWRPYSYGQNGRPPKVVFLFIPLAIPSIPRGIGQKLAPARRFSKHSTDPMFRFAAPWNTKGGLYPPFWNPYRAHPEM